MLLFAGWSFDQALQAWEQESSATCMEVGQRKMLESMVSELSIKIAETSAMVRELEPSGVILKELESAFSRKGIPSFAFEGILGELQVGPLPWVQGSFSS